MGRGYTPFFFFNIGNAESSDEESDAASDDDSVPDRSANIFSDTEEGKSKAMKVEQHLL